MKRTIWVLAGLVAVLAVAAGISARSFFDFGARPDPEEARFVEQQINLHVAALTRGFNFSKASPLFQGDIFPRLSLPVLRGSKPDWSQATVVTVGTSASSSALELYAQLEGKEIQKVHVMSSGPYIPEEFEAFSTDVIILDGTGGTESLNVSDSLHERLGVYAFTSGYLLDADRAVLFAQVNRGNFSALSTAVENFLQRGADGVTPNTQQLLPIGEPLPMGSVPTEFRNELSEELSKPVTLVFLSDSSWCDTCENWLSNADAFIEAWREQGYGLVLVEGGSERFSLQDLPNGVVRLSDVHLPGSATESQVLASWGMTGIPATLVLKNGKLQGEVAWLEVETNGTPYRDIHFRAIEEIIQAVTATSAIPWNIVFRHRAHALKAYSIPKTEG